MTASVLQAADECLGRSSKSRASFSSTLRDRWTYTWTSSRKSWSAWSGNSFTSTVSGQHALDVCLRRVGFTSAYVLVGLLACRSAGLLKKLLMMFYLWNFLEWHKKQSNKVLGWSRSGFGSINSSLCYLHHFLRIFRVRLFVCLFVYLFVAS